MSSVKSQVGDGSLPEASPWTQQQQQQQQQGMYGIYQYSSYYYSYTVLYNNHLSVI